MLSAYRYSLLSNFCCTLFAHNIIILSIPAPAATALAAPRMPSLADRRALDAELACTTCQDPTFHLGLDTYRVPMALHGLNRARLVRAMLRELGDDAATGVVLLEGGRQTTRYDTDHEPVFRQESYFAWAFGVCEADVFGTISLPSGDATVFVPKFDLTYEIFCGASPHRLADEIKAKYGVERVLPIDDLPDFISSQLGEDDDARLHLLRGLNTDSGNMAIPASYEGIGEHASRRSFDTLFKCMAECRVIKTAAEIDLMRYTHWVSSMAHVEVMRAVKVGMMEYQLESLFQHHTYTHGGCRHMSYTCICACGPNPAIMHYGHAGRPNNRELEDGDIALLDMGAEYHCYASDITCSFPVNGRFTDDQLMIYEAVLAAQVAVIEMMKPGVVWTDMHRTAERKILEHLQAGGVLKKGCCIDDMVDADLGAIFMPTGLGHLIGLDTHDVGGYAQGTPARSNRPGLNKLRTARVLEEGMVLTVEPGCYFIDILLNTALATPSQAEFINKDRLEQFRGFGGVRLEDGVLVTKDGCENLTTCPRAVSEVLDVMRGAPWPPEKDVMPEMRRNWATRDKGKMIQLNVPVRPPDKIKRSNEDSAPNA